MNVEIIFNDQNVSVDVMNVEIQGNPARTRRAGRVTVNFI